MRYTRTVVLAKGNSRWNPNTQEIIECKRFYLHCYSMFRPIWLQWGKEMNGRTGQFVPRRCRAHFQGALFDKNDNTVFLINDTSWTAVLRSNYTGMSSRSTFACKSKTDSIHFHNRKWNHENTRGEGNKWLCLQSWELANDVVYLHFWLLRIF